jgi:hypothetical protein
VKNKALLLWVSQLRNIPACDYENFRAIKTSILQRRAF